MAITKTAKVWLGGRKGLTAPIRVSQYDTGWQFQLTVYDGDGIYVGSGGEIAVLNGRKANGAAFSVAGTFASGVATFDCPVTITEAVGVTECELRLTASGETVGTANFDMIVERAPLSGYYASGEDFSAVAQLIDSMVAKVPDAAADWLEDHITNPSNPPIDTSLSVPGAAADAAVTGEEIGGLKDALRTTFSLKYLAVFESVIANGGAIGSTVSLTPEPLPGWGHLIFPCYKGQKFILDSGAGSTYRRWCNTDGNYKIITNSSNQSGEFSETVTALSDGYMILNFNFSTVSYDNCVADIYTAYDREAREVSHENVADIARINAAIDTVHNLLNGVTAHQGYNNAGTIEPSSADYKYYDPVPVKNGVTYVVGPRVRFVCYYNESMMYVSSATIDSSAYAGPQSFTSPIDGYAVVTVYAADYTADKVCMNEGESVLSDIDVKVFKENYVPNDDVIGFVKSKILDLKGLKIYNFGDSIAAGDGNSGVGYAEILASMYGCITTDYAVGGTTLSKVTGQGMGCILNAIDGASATPPDVILLEGGANDYSQFRVTGEVTGATVFSNSSFDETTYIGALELALYKLQTKYPGVPIIWVYTHRENTRTEKTNPDTGVTVNFTTMHDKSLEACAKWAIPVVDMYNEGGLNTNWAGYRTAYTYQGDGTHPNEAGYKKFYIPRIKAKVTEILA